MGRAERRRAARNGSVVRELHSTHSAKLTRNDLDAPRLGLLYGSAGPGRPSLLHAGVCRGPRPGNAMCTGAQLFQHPVFARDPMFGPALAAEERHLYALWAIRVNQGSSCHECEKQLIAAGGDGIYPYLNPQKAI